MNNDFLSSVFLLILLLDPLGNIPFLLSLLKRVPPERRRHIVLRECIIAMFLLILFVFVGDIILSAMKLSESALTISGGLILFLIAMRMVFPSPNQNNNDFDDLEVEPFIVPLAIPMIAGPSALVTVLLAARQAERTMLLVAAIVLASVVSTLILLFADRFSRLFGKSGLAALERLMGLALTTLAVQMLISGIRAAFQAPLLGV